MAILVTGVAGFIGFHVARRLLEQGRQVIGIDCVNDYYSLALKEARLAQLSQFPNMTFYRVNLADKDAIAAIAAKHKDVEGVIHLAAQAGVRYSLINPYAYVESNIMAQVVLLEAARSWSKLKHFVYASSSSVYGGNTKQPFSVDDAVEKPISLYASTKRCDELFGYTYAHLFKIPTTGLRFFSVYGPWGRPDMAAYLFADNILAGKPIPVFNSGNMQRDFTYIDDIVDGVVAALHHIPQGEPQTALYNLGNSHSEKLMDFIGIIERLLGKKAEYNFQPMQMGDVPASCADIAASTRDLGFLPKVRLEQGLEHFIRWYRDYNKMAA